MNVSLRNSLQKPIYKKQKKSSYYSPVTEHRRSFLYIFHNCRYYHCCTLNSTEKIYDHLKIFCALSIVKFSHIYMNWSMYFNAPKLLPFIIRISNDTVVFSVSIHLHVLSGSFHVFRSFYTVRFRWGDIYDFAAT